MRIIMRHISLWAVSVAAVSTLAVTPVLAHNGDDDDGATTSLSSSDDSTEVKTNSNSGSGSRQKVRSAEVEGAEVHKSGDHVIADAFELKQRARQLLQTERQDKKTKSLEARQKACEARKADVLKKQENYTRNGTKHLEVFNKIYDKVLAFKNEKQLDVKNFANLKAAADAKKADAASAVTAVSSFDGTVDCTADDPAITVAELKTTVKNARTALHEYRIAIKDLVVALLATQPDETADASTEGAQ
jgi:hypothetical protein